MAKYDMLRAFADSWGLLLMVLLFVGIVLFTFRPGSGQVHARMANLPLRDDTTPELASEKDGGLK